MKSTNVHAYAKVNWTLNILGTREDGYHLMDMIMQRLELHDDIVLVSRKDGQITLEIDGLMLENGESNLCIRAAKAVQTYAKVARGANIQLTKRIPMGAGLGGGSADAAAVIDGLCDLWGLSLSLEEKCAIGLKLGADVPYCLHGIPARVTGIGEHVHEIPMKRTFPMVLLQPCEALSTKEAFRHFDATPQPVLADTEQALAAFQSGKVQDIARHCRNVMQPASQLLRPEMNEAIRRIQSTGAFLSQMTGSGSVVFGAYANDAEADHAYELLKEHYPVCIRTETLL